MANPYGIKEFQLHDDLQTKLANLASGLLDKLPKGTHYTNADQIKDDIVAISTGVQGVGATTSNSPTGTGVASWVFAGGGTYTNYGGLVIPANYVGFITRSVSDVYSYVGFELDLSLYSKKEDVLYNKVTDRLVTENDALSLVGSYSGNKVDTFTYNTFAHPTIKLKNSSKNFKAVGWRAAEYASSAGFSKQLDFDLSNYSEGDIINVRFFMRTNGLTPVANNVAKQALVIGANLIPINVANSETTVENVGNGWSKYVTRHVLTASDISEGVITSVDLIYYASTTPATDSLEVAGMEVYFNDVDLVGLKIEEITNDVIALVPTIENSNGKIVLNSSDTLVSFGNNALPFVSEIKTTAEFAGLNDVSKNTIVYKGLGWRAAEYTCYAGFKANLSDVSLSELGSVVGDKLKAIYYIKSNVIYDYPATHGLFIGTNKIDILTNSELTITDVGNGWKKYELLHTVTNSDITQDDFVRFEWSSYGGFANQIATQSVEITTPLIYINDLQLYGYYINQATETVSKRVDRLTTRQRRWQGKKMIVEGDSITAFENYQYKVQEQCEIATVISDGIPGQQLGTMADRLTLGDLADVDLITFWGGTNDYGGGKTVGTISDARTVDTFYGNVKKIIHTVLTLKPSIQMAFFTPLKRGAFESQPVYPAANGAGYFLYQYVNAIKEVCELYSIPVLDLYSEGGLNEYTLSTYTVDNLHPNEAGFVMLSKKMSAFLETL